MAGANHASINQSQFKASVTQQFRELEVFPDLSVRSVRFNTYILK